MDSSERATRLRGARLVHLAISLGLAMAGGVFLLLRRLLLEPPPLRAGQRFGTAAAVVLLGVLLMGIVVGARLRDARAAGQPLPASAEERWARWFGRLIIEWAVIEFFGLVGVIGWWLTGATAMLGLAAVALITLLLRGPDRQLPDA